MLIDLNNSASCPKERTTLNSLLGQSINSDYILSLPMHEIAS